MLANYKFYITMEYEFFYAIGEGLEFSQGLNFSKTAHYFWKGARLNAKRDRDENGEPRTARVSFEIQERLSYVGLPSSGYWVPDAEI